MNSFRKTSDSNAALPAFGRPPTVSATRVISYYKMFDQHRDSKQAISPKSTPPTGHSPKSSDQQQPLEEQFLACGLTSEELDELMNGLM